MAPASSSDNPSSAEQREFLTPQRNSSNREEVLSKRLCNSSDKRNNHYTRNSYARDMESSELEIISSNFATKVTYIKELEEELEGLKEFKELIQMLSDLTLEKTTKDINEQKKFESNRKKNNNISNKYSNIFYKNFKNTRP